MQRWEGIYLETAAKVIKVYLASLIRDYQTSLPYSRENFRALTATFLRLPVRSGELDVSKF